MGYFADKKLKLEEGNLQYSWHSAGEEFDFYVFWRSLQNFVFHACTNEDSRQNHVQPPLQKIRE